MNGHSGRRWAGIVLALLAAVAIGAIAYQAGVAHGAALQSPYYGYGPRFGFFGPLFGILFFFFILRMVLFGLFGWGWGWRRWRHYDYRGDGPSRFDDWHRRAHERMRDSSAPAPPTA